LNVAVNSMTDKDCVDKIVGYRPARLIPCSTNNGGTVLTNHWQPVPREKNECGRGAERRGIIPFSDPFYNPEISVPYICVAVGLNINDPSLDPSTCNTAGVGSFGSRDADLMHDVH
jgi:hypothetical protein